MRKTLLAFFAILCGTASAQVGWSFPDEVTIAPGGTATFTVNLDDAEYETYISGSFNISFPEGITVVDGTAKANADRIVDHAFTATLNSGVYNCVITSSSNAYIKGTSGSLVSFDLKCADDVEKGEYSATISRWNMTYYDEEEDDLLKVTKTNVTVKIIVGEAAAETETVTLAKEYNTYIPTKDLDFSGVEGIKAYYVTAVTATEATLTEATTVAAGEGIIISGTPANYPADYEVPVASGEVAKNDDNLLKTSGIAVNDYILYNGKFVLCSDGELAEGKAYLPASAITSGAKVINIVFGGESTGISEVKKSEADSAIYNLSGMRVSKTQKGVYIMNGRKVIVK